LLAMLQFITIEVYTLFATVHGRAYAVASAYVQLVILWSSGSCSIPISRRLDFIEIDIWCGYLWFLALFVTHRMIF
jgi:hypothetical protein